MSTDEISAIYREAQNWVVRLDSGRATADDAQAFKRWCGQSRSHATAFVQARKVWLAMRQAGRQVEQGMRDTRRLRSGAGIGFRPGRRAFLGAMAASAAYLAVRPPMQLWPSLTEWVADYRTGTGEQREIVVADGLVVQMNTQTRINVQSGNAALELVAGEAEIQTGLRAAARVTVLAGGGAVSADRGRFNIRHIGGEVCVTCLAGQVDVAQGAHRATLVAEQQLTYGPRRFGAPQSADPAVVTAWRQRLLVFNQTPLSTVVDEVNRYRPGKLILTDARLGQSKVQASFSIDRLEDVTALIHDVYGVAIRHLPGGIVLLG